MPLSTPIGVGGGGVPRPAQRLTRVGRRGEGGERDDHRVGSGVEPDELAVDPIGIDVPSIVAGRPPLVAVGAAGEDPTESGTFAGLWITAGHRMGHERLGHDAGIVASPEA